jgi:hypothetical protein
MNEVEINTLLYVSYFKNIHSSYCRWEAPIKVLNLFKVYRMKATNSVWIYQNLWSCTLSPYFSRFFLGEPPNQTRSIWKSRDSGIYAESFYIYLQVFIQVTYSP